MNIRSLIKLRKSKLSLKTDGSYDNPYEYKLEIWHGHEEAPFHDSICFTESELESLIENIISLSEKVLESFGELQKSK